MFPTATIAANTNSIRPRRLCAGDTPHPMARAQRLSGRPAAVGPTRALPFFANDGYDSVEAPASERALTSPSRQLRAWGVQTLLSRPRVDGAAEARVYAALATLVRCGDAFDKRTVADALLAAPARPGMLPLLNQLMLCCDQAVLRDVQPLWTALVALYSASHPKNKKRHPNKRAG